MFKNNKYTKIYFQIVDRAQNREISPKDYYERHHIIPRSIGGDNKASNLVPLTAREHLLCHLLLVRMVTDERHHRSMIHAMQLMLHGGNRHQPRYKKINSRIYENLKIQWSKAASKRSREYWDNLTPEEYTVTCEVRRAAANTPKVVAAKTHHGEANGMYGKKHSPESIKLMQEKTAGRYKGMSYEDRHGKELAADLIQKRRISQTNAMAERDTTGANNSNAKAVHIQGLEFTTASEAAVHFGKSRPCISGWIKNRDDCWIL
jgi:hypothetical protein